MVKSLRPQSHLSGLEASSVAAHQEWQILALNFHPTLPGRQSAAQSQTLCSTCREPLTATAVNISDPLAGCPVLSTCNANQGGLLLHVSQKGSGTYRVVLAMALHSCLVHYGRRIPRVGGYWEAAAV